MQEHTNLTPAERELEAALAALRPAAPVIDRDGLMFRAGQASARGRTHVWQAAAAGLALAFGVSLVTRSSPSAGRPGVQVAVAPGTATEPQSTALPEFASLRPLSQSPSAYWRVRAAVLTRGTDALAAPTGGAGNGEPELRLHRLLETAPQSSRKLNFFGIQDLILSGEQS